MDRAPERRSARTVEFRQNGQVMSESFMLTAGVRRNLHSLQSTVEQLSVMQNLLATGNKMSSAPGAGAFDALMQAGSKPQGASQLALQTRQQLPVTDLSLADQASHALLMVF
jgi:hypothetical protein